MVAGSSLENAAWFRRTLAVIPQPEVGSDQSSNVESEISEPEPLVPPPTVPSGNTSNTSSYSTQALCVLAEVLAPVLDMVFGSDEKERMTSFLTTVMYNVTPFLKNHRYESHGNFKRIFGIADVFSMHPFPCQSGVRFSNGSKPFLARKS